MGNLMSCFFDKEIREERMDVYPYCMVYVANVSVIYLKICLLIFTFNQENEGGEAEEHHLEMSSTSKDDESTKEVFLFVFDI